jgi:RNA polymerase sigma-70 factor (ECF subfamily)
MTPEATAWLGERHEAPVVEAPVQVVRLRDLYGRYADFVARQLRRLGVYDADLEDAVQEVFIVTSRRLEEIVPDRERAFLFGTAMRVASHARRDRGRRRDAVDTDATARVPDQTPGADELLERRRARALLDQILDRMTDDLRAAFVLFELEGLTMAEIAALLEVPPGTIASRIRRAREQFEREVTLLRESETLPWRDR